MKQVKLLVKKTYPAAWVFNFKPLQPGTIVPVIPANNIPNCAGCYWIMTPELKDDPYGILLRPGEYENITD